MGSCLLCTTSWDVFLALEFRKTPPPLLQRRLNVNFKIKKQIMFVFLNPLHHLLTEIPAVSHFVVTKFCFISKSDSIISLGKQMTMQDLQYISIQKDVSDGLWYVLMQTQPISGGIIYCVYWTKRISRWIVGKIQMCSARKRQALKPKTNKQKAYWKLRKYIRS